MAPPGPGRVRRVYRNSGGWPPRARRPPGHGGPVRPWTRVVSPSPTERDMVRGIGSRLTVAVAATLVWAFGGAAQTVDQGVFQLSVNGQPVGSEEFVIQRTGSGAAQTTLARGTLTLSGATISTQLQVTGLDLSVFRYSVQVTGEDARSVNVARTGNRLQARTVAPWGEELREYRATGQTLLLDRGVAHHYFLLSRFLEDVPSSGSRGIPTGGVRRNPLRIRVGDRLPPPSPGNPRTWRILRVRGPGTARRRPGSTPRGTWSASPMKGRGSWRSARPHPRSS